MLRDENLYIVERNKRCALILKNNNADYPKNEKSK